MQSGYSIDFNFVGVRGGVCRDASLHPEVIRPVQTHSCNIAVISDSYNIPGLEDTDAIICSIPGLKIGVRTADCVPVLIYAPDIRAVAAIHAGWKGSIGGIVSKTLIRLRESGADLARAEAAFGPSICGSCYEISPELSEEFRSAGYGDCFVSPRHIDLESVNYLQLLTFGISPENIQRKRCCTYETPQLPSWRREPSDVRLLTWISLRPLNLKNFMKRGLTE